MNFAGSSIAEAVKFAKGQFKNTLLPKYMPSLVSVGAIGETDGTLVLEDASGARIELRDRSADGEDHASVSRLRSLPVRADAGSVLFGLVLYDETDRHICMHPYSLITADEIFRLQY